MIMYKKKNNNERMPCRNYASTELEQQLGENSKSILKEEGLGAELPLKRKLLDLLWDTKGD